MWVLLLRLKEAVGAKCSTAVGMQAPSKAKSRQSFSAKTARKSPEWMYLRPRSIW